jgi:hypothetical protein
VIFVPRGSPEDASRNLGEANATASILLSAGCEMLPGLRTAEA